MIRKRNGNSSSVNETRISNNENEIQNDPNKRFFVETKTWKERAIEVLDYMDNEGINIYDPNNYPGMYLKNHKKTSNGGNIPLAFKQSSDSNEQKENIPNNLLNHFKSNK